MKLTKLQKKFLKTLAKDKYEEYLLFIEKYVKVRRRSSEFPGGT